MMKKISSVKNISLHGEVLVPDEDGKLRKLTLGKIMWTDGMGKMHQSYTLVPPIENTGGTASEEAILQEAAAREAADDALLAAINDLGIPSLGYYQGEIDLGSCQEDDLETVLFASSDVIARWDALFLENAGACQLYKIKILVTPNGKVPAADETEPTADAGVAPEPELWQGYFLTMTGYRIESEEDTIAWTQTLTQRILLHARPYTPYFDRTRQKTNTYYLGVGERYAEGDATEWYDTSEESEPTVSAVSFLNMPVSESEPEDGSAYWGEAISESQEGTVEVSEEELVADNMEVASTPSGTVTLFNQIADEEETASETVYLNKFTVATDTEETES